MLKKIFIAGLVIALLGAAYGYFFMYNKSHPDYENMDAEISISADELFHSCRENGLAVKYTGKLLEISGIPSNIEINDSSVTVVFTYDEGMFGPEGVRATFLKHYNDELSHIPSNKKLVIKAYCTGYNETDVILEKASLVK